MKSKIAVVDDEKDIRDILEVYLNNEGYDVFKLCSGEDALKFLEREEVHLIILDIMMPGMDGMVLCRKIREKSNVPILMLSAKSQSMDKVQGILTGADDYMVKPFEPLELTVKVKALLRRTYYFNDPIINKDVITAGSVVINKNTHKILVGNKEVTLTAKEFDILFLLASNKGIVFSSEDIFEKIWKEKYFQSNNTVMVHMSRLRDKLNKYTNGEKIIHTVWGVGYKIEEEN